MPTVQTALLQSELGVGVMRMVFLLVFTSNAHLKRSRVYAARSLHTSQLLHLVVSWRNSNLFWYWSITRLSKSWKQLFNSHFSFWEILRINLAWCNFSPYLLDLEPNLHRKHTFLCNFIKFKQECHHLVIPVPTWFIFLLLLRHCIGINPFGQTKSTSSSQYYFISETDESCRMPSKWYHSPDNKYHKKKSISLSNSGSSSL